MAEPPKLLSLCSAKMRAWRARFEAAHADVVAALQQQDYDSLSAAIRCEAQLVLEYRALIDEQHTLLAQVRERVMLDRFIGEGGWATE